MVRNKKKSTVNKLVCITILKGWNWNLVLTYLGRCHLSVIWLVDFIFLVFTFFDISILKNMLAWCTNTQMENIFLQSFWIECYIFFIKKGDKIHGFQWATANSLGLFCSCWFTYCALWNTFQHRGKKSECHSSENEGEKKPVYSSNQKHKLFDVVIPTCLGS